MSITINEKLTITGNAYNNVLNWCFNRINTTKKDDDDDDFWKRLVLFNDYDENTKQLKSAYTDEPIRDLAETFLPGCNGGRLYYSHPVKQKYLSFSKKDYLDKKIILIHLGNPCTLLNMSGVLKKDSDFTRMIIETGEVLEIVETQSKKFYESISIKSESLEKRFFILFWTINPNLNSKLWMFGSNESHFNPFISNTNYYYNQLKKITTQKSEVLLSDNASSSFNTNVRTTFNSLNYSQEKVKFFDLSHIEMAKKASKGVIFFYEFTDRFSQTVIMTKDNKNISQKINSLRNNRKSVELYPVFNISSDSKNISSKPSFPAHIKVGASLSATKNPFSVSPNYSFKDKNGKIWNDVSSAFKTYQTNSYGKNQEIMTRILTTRFEQNQVLWSYIELLGGVNFLNNCCSFHIKDNFPGQKEYWDGWGFNSLYLTCLKDAYLEHGKNRFKH